MWASQPDWHHVGLAAEGPVQYRLSLRHSRYFHHNYRVPIKMLWFNRFQQLWDFFGTPCRSFSDMQIEFTAKVFAFSYFSNIINYFTFKIGTNSGSTQSPRFTSIRRSDSVSKYLEEYSEKRMERRQEETMSDGACHWTRSCALILAHQPWMSRDYSPCSTDIDISKQQVSKYTQIWHWSWKLLYNSIE